MHTRPASPRHQYPQRHLTVLTPPSADSSSDSDAASSSSSWSTPSLQWQQQLVRALLDILPLKERLSLELFSSGFAVPGATKDEVLSYAVAVVLHFKAHPLLSPKPQIDDACRQSIVIPAQQALALLNSVNTAASLFNARLSQLMDALEAQACASEAAYADTLSHIAQNMAREEDILRRNISVWHRHLVVPPVTHMRSGKQAVVSCSRKPSFLATHAAVLPGAAPHARP
ncbi:hypothetical protein RI367_004541 [Sorochytrium milnesiophthora]